MFILLIFSICSISDFIINAFINKSQIDNIIIIIHALTFFLDFPSVVEGETNPLNLFYP